MSLRGGWYTRHYKQCRGSSQSDSSRIASPEPRQSTSAAAAATAEPGTSAQRNDDEDADVDVDISTLPETDEIGRSVCRNCGKYFAKVGGWWTKHVVYCTGENRRNIQVSLVRITNISSYAEPLVPIHFEIRPVVTELCS